MRILIVLMAASWLIVSAEAGDFVVEGWSVRVSKALFEKEKADTETALDLLEKPSIIRMRSGCGISVVFAKLSQRPSKEARQPNRANM